MNFLILGDGVEEHAWARALSGHAVHRLAAAFPGFDDLADVPEPLDLDDALAAPGFDAVVVGGGLDFRAEALRRVAAEGLPAVCLHPPGPDSEAYYQVALSGEETGAVIVPDLAARLHPGVDEVRRALDLQALGTFRLLRYEAPAGPEGADLARYSLPRAIDLVRSILGEIEELTATGEPAGERPTGELIVHLRGPQGRRAEVRLRAGSFEPARLVAEGSEATLSLEFEPSLAAPARLIRRAGGGEEVVTTLERWDPHEALLGVLTEAVGRRDVHPNLLDGTRATELGEATARSLRRGRTVDLYYEKISEAGTFKSVMTSFGCVLLMGVIAALPVALAGPVLGFPWTIYIAYAIPPVLIMFVALQALRFGIRAPARPGDESLT